MWNKVNSNLVLLFYLLYAWKSTKWRYLAAALRPEGRGFLSTLGFSIISSGTPHGDDNISEPVVSLGGWVATLAEDEPPINSHL